MISREAEYEDDFRCWRNGKRELRFLDPAERRGLRFVRARFFRRKDRLSRRNRRFENQMHGAFDRDWALLPRVATELGSTELFRS